jgi:hypothetical protein
LYEHWERHQWSPLPIDFSVDAATLDADRDQDTFVRAVLAYHVIAEGSIGRANQRFVATRLKSPGEFRVSSRCSGWPSVTCGGILASALRTRANGWPRLRSIGYADQDRSPSQERVARPRR